MALRTEAVDTKIVRDILSITTKGVQALGDHINVNKWSKYKPVAFNWPRADGSYGLIPKSNWIYSPRPVGNLSQFAGYEHNGALAFPCINSNAANNTIRTLNPEGTPTSNTWRIDCFKSASDVRLTPVDLGLENYYFGFKITIGGNDYYKTYGNVADFAEASDTFVTKSLYADLQNPNTTPSFSDLPYGTGTYIWTLIFCSEQVSDWTQTVPFEVIEFMYDVLNGVVYDNSGAFVVNTWFTSYNGASPDNYLYWEWNDSDWQELTIYTNNGVWSEETQPADWLETDNLGHGNGSVYRIRPSFNYGVERTCDVWIGRGNSQSLKLTFTQQAIQLPPTVTPHIMEGENFTVYRDSLKTISGINYTATIGFNTLSVSFYTSMPGPSERPAAFVVKDASMNTLYSGTCTIYMFTDPTIELVTLSRTLVSNDQLHLYLGSLTHSLTVNPTSYNFIYTGGSITPAITANNSNIWVSSESASWITLTDPTGSGNGHFHISCDAQIDGAPARGTTVYIDSYSTQRTIDITQNAYPPPPTLSTDQNGNTLYFDEFTTPCSVSSINVTSNTSWTVTYGDTWVYGTMSGTGNETIYFNVLSNAGMPFRNATITVSTSGCADQVTTIEQMATGETCA